MKIEIDIKEISIGTSLHRRDLIAITLFKKDLDNYYVDCVIRVAKGTSEIFLREFLGNKFDDFEINKYQY
jgi:hypothetical protein